MDKLIEWLTEYLAIEDFRQADVSLNGLQIGRRNPEIKMVVFAVDACLESLERAAAAGADMLIVHHGLFWGSPIAVTGSHYDRIACAVENDLALFAAHLPLDAHPEVGNNAAMADVLNLENRRSFGRYHGVDIGVMGEFSSPVILPEVRRLLGFADNVTALTFGDNEKITSAALVSVGAASSVIEAIA
nr:Nif3-like dinuclear metal center hexameric protein [Spirochaetales bacterium]